MSCLSTVWWRSRFNLTVWWIVLKKAEKQISTFLLWWCSKPSQDKAEAANPICVNFISCTCVLWLNKSASKLTKCEVIIDLKTDPNWRQAGSFQNLQTLVEVSSILAAQGVYTNPETSSERPEAARQTILSEQTAQQQAYHQPPGTATW